MSALSVDLLMFFASRYVVLRFVVWIVAVSFTLNQEININVNL